ncbi:hypothetical protein KPH14_012871, partial [Odynerus spinipes]
RHLERAHRNEEYVKKFVALPKGNIERKKIIETIRRNGNFLYNTEQKYNNDDLIVCRRPQINRKCTAQNFISRAKCKGFFTKNNIRHHFQQCAKKNVGRHVQVLGRAIQGRIHPLASDTLRKIIFLVLREDAVTRAICYDELLIIYANKMCIKYQHQHQQDMIRSCLRLLDRFLNALKNLNENVTHFASIYKPSIYDDCVRAINVIARYDSTKQMYEAPSVASRLGTLIKQIGKLLITECIKRNDVERQQTTENYLKLLVEDFGITVNKTVEETVSH